MKKHILSLVALFATMSIQAQVVKVYDTESATPTTPIATYTNGDGHKYKVVFEEAPDANLLTGKFSVSADKTVQFTKGNLQATYSTETSSYSWGFAANQWESYRIALTNQGNVSIGTNQKDGCVVDLFCWSNSTTHYGIKVSGNADPFSGDFVDWGGLFPDKGYFTLSKDEWDYLLNYKSTSGARTQTNRFAKAMVNGEKGLLIFPDNYKGTTAVTGITGIAKVNNTSAEYPTESIPTDTWTTMESDGVVFLPAGGFRLYYSIYDNGAQNNKPYGYYWTSTPRENNTAHYMTFSSSVVSATGYRARNYGYSVRLVSAVSE